MLKSKTFSHLSKKFFVVSAIFIVVFLLIFLGIMRFFASTPNSQQEQSVPVVENNNNATTKNDNVSVEKPSANDVELSTAQPNPNQFASENFRLENINFGGDAFLPTDQDENMPIEISNVKNESFLNNKGDESKVVISWKSNKLTMANVVYSKNDGQNAKTISEGGFGFSHSLVISGLDLGTGYIYKIKSTDRWSNKNETDFFGFYSGEKSQSIIELIGKEFNSIFSWAIK